MLRHPRGMCLHSKQQGFTLVELMVTVAVIGILAMIAYPSMSSMVNNGRLKGQTEELVSAMQLARSEAVRRNANVKITASADGVTPTASAAWAGWVVQGRDNAANATEVIRGNVFGSAVQVTGPAVGIEFKPSGLLESSQQLTVTVAGQSRMVCVQVSGVVLVKSGACS